MVPVAALVAVPGLLCAGVLAPVTLDPAALDPVGFATAALELVL